MNGYGVMCLACTSVSVGNILGNTDFSSLSVEF
jgi:hypothetical protein